MTTIYQHNQPFHLESGKVLQQLQLAYTTFGSLNSEKNNVVWIFHALTANSNPEEWWPGLVGKGHLIDPSRYCIICVNMPGSCYGSINALDLNPQTNIPWYHSFPWFTTRDMIHAYRHLKQHLGINKIHIGLGGSMGGQQLLEWAVEEPSLFDYIIPIATNAKHSPLGIAFNASQRLCIENDATWKENNERAGIEGMKIARSIALISYRSYETYYNTQQGFTPQTVDAALHDRVFNAESYQRYQGDKLAKRFNAFSYYFLSKGMDSHDLSRGRQSTEAVLQNIQAKTLVIGITSDMLFPVNEQEYLAKHIPGARYAAIESFYGHDGFLLEFDAISGQIKELIKEDDSR